MVEFRKRKSDGQPFPVKNGSGMKAINPRNEVGGMKMGKGTKIPRMKEVPIFKFDEADEELQEKILEKQRNLVAEDSDNFFAQDEGIIFDKVEKVDGSDIGLKNLFPETFEVGGNRGDDFIQFDLEIENMTKFAKYLGLSEKLLKKIGVGFRNDTGTFGSNNTALEFTDVNGSIISLESDTGALDEHYSEDKDLDEDERMFNKEDIPTLEEFKSMLRAHDKFADLMDSALQNLTNNYENQFEDDTIIENIKANDYDFDEDGNIA